MIGREPLVDNQVDFKRAFTQAKPARCLLAAISGVAVDRYVKEDFVGHWGDHLREWRDRSIYSRTGDLVSHTLD